MNKKDFKYIIKRILIGVGIILCVGFLNKCSVKAEEKTDAYLSVLGFPSALRTSPAFSYSTHDYTFSISNYNINVYNGGGYPDYFSLIFKDNNNNYLVLTNNGFQSLVNLPNNTTFDKVNFTPNNYELYNNDTLVASSTDYPGYFSISVFSQDIEFINDISFELVYNYSINSYFNEYYNDTIYNYSFNLYYYGDSTPTLTWYNIINYLYSNFELVHTSTDMEINGTNIDIPPIPSYYSSIDMQEHEGVYFVPKDYSTIITIQNSIGEVVIPFNYYYKGNFAEGYFPLNDYSKIVFSLNNIISREQFLYSKNWFPYQQVIDSNTYDYYAYVLQNKDINSFSQHYDSIIYYDSRYFDYYFIDDFSSYNQTISFIDKNGISFQLDVSINNSLKQLYKNGIQNDGTNSYIGNQIIHSLDNNVLSQYLEFITIPFDFLKSFTSSTCTSINVPLPFVEGAITLPCISSVLNEHVPQLLNIIVIVVNGFLVYRITMRNIDTCTDVVKADDDKIEVIDL